MTYEYIGYYFTTPSQVKYLDELQQYRGGICIYDDLILSNGDIVKSKPYALNLAKRFERDPEDIIIPLTWNDLSDAILVPNEFWN